MSTQASAVEAIAKAGLSIRTITNLFTNQPGPLPLEKKFASSGGTLIFFVSGSLFALQGTVMVMNISLDTDIIGNCQVANASPSTYAALIPVLLTTVQNPPAGNHVIELTIGSTANFASDVDCFFNVTVIELAQLRQ